MKLLNVLTFITFFFYSLGHVGRVSLENQQINIYLYELSLVGMLIYLMLKHKAAPLHELTAQWRSIGIFSAYLTITFLLTITLYDVLTSIVGGLYLLRLLFYFILFIYLSHKKNIFSQQIHSSFFVMLGLVIVFSLFQYFLYPDLRNIIYMGWDPHLYRMLGTFFDPPIAGAIYVLFFIFVLLNNKLPLVHKYILNSGLGIMIFLTYSRITYVAFFITMSLWILRHKGVKYIFLFISVFLIGLFLLPRPFGESVNLTRVFSIESRLKDYKEAVEVWQESPVIGVGYNRLRYVRESYTSDNINFESSHAGASFHSSFLIMLATGGILGLVLFIWVLLQIARISPMSRYMTIFLSIASLTDNVLLHPFIMFLAVILATLRESHKEIKTP